MTIVTVTPRAAASAVTASIWVLLPSTSTAHSLLWPGSRRSASSKAAAMTAGMASVTEAVSHLPRACGSRGFPVSLGLLACALFFLRFCAGVLMMSPGVRGTGAASQTQASSAIRLRPFFSPGDSLVASLPSAAAAAFAVAGRSAPGSITMPFPSKVSTSGHPSGAGLITRHR